MDNRKWQAAASATPPADEASPSSGYPTDGNPSTPTPATIPGARWFHQVGEEIRAVIAAAGLTPDSTVLTQLRDAIQAMIVGAQKAVIVNGVTFEASVADGEAVRWDSGNSRFDEAIADGTANNRAVGIADVTNSRVYLYGECPLFSGLTPGSRYYLDASTAGAITATAPADAVQIGIAKSATVLWVDVDAVAAVRTRLTGALTLYVATTGSDSNNGLSAGSPFLTIQKAWNVLHGGYDLAGYTATIQLADGAYNAGLLAKGLICGQVSEASVVVKGNSGNSAAVTVAVTGGVDFYAQSGASFTVSNLTLGGGIGLAALGNNSRISGGAGLVFAACASAHIYSVYGGLVQVSGNYTITGGSTSHWVVVGGYILAQGLTITLTGTPGFSISFANSTSAGLITADTNTFTGSATGARYGAQTNGVINTNGAGASYLPGNAAGTTATGGVYA